MKEGAYKSGSEAKRVFSGRMWERKEVKAALQDGSRAWITLLACVCADGSALPPGLIYEAVNKAIQSDWVEDIKAGKHRTYLSPPRPQTGQTAILALPGLSRYLTAILRQKLDDRIDHSL